MHLECLEQKSLIQEIIEATGHMCIFLSKFHWVFLGGQSKSIFAITVIILLPLSKKTSQRHLHLRMWKQSGNRNIRWFDACMHIEMARGQKRHSSRSKPLALTSMHLIVMYQREWWGCSMNKEMICNKLPFLAIYPCWPNLNSQNFNNFLSFHLFKYPSDRILCK